MQCCVSIDRYKAEGKVWQLENENENCLNVDEVVNRFHYLRRKNGLQPGSLGGLLKGSRLSFPQEIKVAANADLLKRRVFLAKRAEGKAYSRLSAGVVNPEDNERVGKLIPKLSIGANMILAVASCFIVGYVASSCITEHQHLRLTAGLIAMIIILFVEMTLFVIRETKSN
mmetsp:Transcript_15389/g.30865  ORF Transcript_15389/g.30865 Transcript_15389/m.30865 type:complete len:171 (+) Transcript_15389:52-564(+)